MDDCLFSINNFCTPKMIDGVSAIGMQILRLILLEPGTYESHPDMGVGIVSRFRYSFEGNAGQLKNEIQKQISKYLPQVQAASVYVSDDGGVYHIQISMDDELININYDPETNEMNINSL